MKGKGKGITYILGIATIAFCSAFTVGCGSKITGIVTDNDEIQLVVDLGASYNGAISDELKKEIFDQLSAQTETSDGQRNDIVWDANKVSIELDQSETKKWGAETGEFKFRLTYENQYVIFKVLVDAVPTGLTANLNQSTTLENIIALGGTREAVEASIAVTLTERYGFNTQGEAEFRNVPLTSSAQREYLTFDWAPADASAGISVMPDVDKVTQGKYQVVVSYQLPASDVVFSTDPITFEVKPSSPATFTSTGQEYGKVLNQNITQTGDANSVVVKVSGVIKYEAALDEYLGQSVDMANGNIVGLKVVAPTGIKTRDCDSATLKISKTTNGINYETVREASQNGENPFIFTDALSQASFDVLLNFTNKTEQFRIEVKWSGEDEVKTYTVSLNETAVLEEPETIGFKVEWADGEDSQEIIYNEQDLVTVLNQLKQNISLVRIKEDGELSEPLDNVQINWGTDFDVTKPGRYEVVLTYPEYIPGVGDRGALAVVVAEPNAATISQTIFDVDDEELTPINLLTFTQVDGSYDVLISGKIDFHYASNTNDEMVGKQNVPSGYYIPVSISSANYISPSQNAVVTVYKGVNNDAYEIVQTLSGLEAFNSNEIATIELFLHPDNANTTFKIEIQWNENVEAQTYTVQFDKEKTEFSYATAETFTESYAYNPSITMAQTGALIEFGGIIPVVDANEELGMAKENVVSFRLTAPKVLGQSGNLEQIMHNDDAKIVIYKSSTLKNTVVSMNIEGNDIFGYLASLGQIDNFGELIGQGTLDSVSGNPAYVDVYLGMEVNEVFFVGVDWTNSGTFTYYAVCYAEDAEVEAGQATAFNFQNNISQINYGLSLEQLIKDIKKSATAQIKTTEREEYHATNNYEITLKEGQTFDSTQIGKQITFVATYLGSVAGGQATFTKEFTLTVTAPISPVETVVKDVLEGAEYDYYSLSYSDGKNNIIDITVNGLLPYRYSELFEEEINALDFRIYSPFYYSDMGDGNTITAQDISQFQTDSNFAFKFYKQNDNGEWEISKEWTLDEAQAELKTGSLTSKISSAIGGASVGNEVSFENVNYIDWQVSISETKKPFKIEVTWGEGVTYTYHFNLENVEFEQALATEDLFGAVTVIDDTDEYTLEENNTTQDNLSDYIISGIFSVATQEDDSPDVNIQISSPVNYASYILESEADNPDNITYYATNGYIKVYYDNNLVSNLSYDGVNSMWLTELENDNWAYNLSFYTKDIIDINSIRVTIKWDSKYKPVDYYFDVSNIRNMVNPETKVTVINGNYELLNDVYYITNSISKSESGENLGKYAQRVKFVANGVEPDFENAKLIVLKSNDGFKTVINADGEEVSFEDNIENSDSNLANSEELAYQILMGNEFLDSVSEHATFEYEFVFDTISTAYSIIVVWGNAVETQSFTIVPSPTGQGFELSQADVSKNIIDSNYATSNDISFIGTQTETLVLDEQTLTDAEVYSYKVSGALNYEQNKYGMGENFVFGATITKPSDVEDISNSIVKTYRKSADGSWELINEYLAGEANDNKEQITVFYRVYNTTDEYMVLVDWDGTVTTIDLPIIDESTVDQPTEEQASVSFIDSGAYQQQIFKFTLDSAIKFNLPESTITAESALNDYANTNTIEKVSDFNYNIGGHLELFDQNTDFGLDRGFATCVKITESPINENGQPLYIANNSTINVLKKQGETFVNAASNEFYVMETNVEGVKSYYVFMLFDGRDDQYKIEINWSDQTIYNTQTYMFAVRGDAEFCAKGEVGAVSATDNDGYAYSPDVIVSENPEDENEIVTLTFTGTIPYSESNNALTGTTNSGNFVGVYLQAPEGITTQNAKIKVATKAQEADAWGTYTTSSLNIADGLNKVYYYAFFSNITQQYKIIVSWNEDYESQEVIIKLGEQSQLSLGPATLVLEQDVVANTYTLGNDTSIELGGAIKTTTDNKIATSVTINKPSIVTESEFEKATIKVYKGQGSSADWEELSGFSVTKSTSGYGLNLSFDNLDATEQYKIEISWGKGELQTYFFSLDLTELDLVVENDYTLSSNFSLTEGCVWTVNGKLTVADGVTLTVTERAALSLGSAGIIENYDRISSNGTIDVTATVTANGTTYAYSNLASIASLTNITELNILKDAILQGEEVTITLSADAEFTIAQGVRLTVSNGATLDLSSMTPESIQINGVINDNKGLGTIKYPEGYKGGGDPDTE